MPRFDTPLNTNDQSIDRVLNAGLPVLLVVWSGRLDPSLDEALRQVARTDAGRLLVARANADENPQIAARTGGPLPALISYRDGQEVARGAAITAQTFRAHADHLLGRGPRPADESAPPRTAGAGASAPSRPVTVTDASFQAEVLNSDLPVVVDLWAPWCAPCRIIAPVLDKLAGEYAGRLKIAKVNVDENPRTSGMLQVQGIPTLLLFRDGQLVDRIVGPRRTNAAPEIGAALGVQ